MNAFDKWLASIKSGTASKVITSSWTFLKNEIPAKVKPTCKQPKILSIVLVCFPKPSIMVNDGFRFALGDLIPGKMTQILLPKYFEKLFVIPYPVV